MTKKLSVFKFKQFEVDQTGCAMKINTDGVLLGALADVRSPETILDIGTGTGVIALMLAQRFNEARIDAIDVEEAAADTAGRNFAASPFAGRLTAYPLAFEEYFKQHADKRYHLIVSNPPFFLNSLQSPGQKRTLARHTDEIFFDRLMIGVASCLTRDGSFVLIVPTEIAALVKQKAFAAGLFVHGVILIRSFAGSEPHREIITLGLTTKNTDSQEFIIYKAEKIYTVQYQQTLKNFFTIF